MSSTEQQLGEAIQKFVEQLVEIRKTLAAQAVGLISLKVALAASMDRENPERALASLNAIESEVAKRDHNSQALKQVGDIIEAARLADKHGGAHEA